MMDLNVVWSPSPDAQAELRSTVSLLQKLGYQGVCYNLVVDGKNVNVHKSNPIKPLPVDESGDVQGFPHLLSQNKSKRTRQFYQFSRITVIMSDHTKNYGLTNPSQFFSSFDIIAVQPMNEKAFQLACSTLDIDIISLDFSVRLPFYMRAPQINAAVSRGVQFEICYSCAIRDSESRRHLISNASSLIRLTKGKNVIVSSQAQAAMDVRGPYDVLNLCSFFGMNAAIARQAMTAACQSALSKAAARRSSYRSVMSIEGRNELGASDSWKAGFGDDDFVSLSDNDMDMT
ncbi:RNase P subunit p30-domain-containing protein [Cladochytrium replicatum]|nr:RNase P subunit p30-domain-containing protein [Cladochytrium replicatum]